MKALSMVAVAILATSACSGAQHRPPRSRLSVKEIVERSKPAIVRIESEVNGQGQVGTGFAVDPSGIIATNLHVVAGAKQIKVTLLDGHAYEVTRIVSVDPTRDLTLLAIEVDMPMPSLTIGDSDAMVAGDPVVAIGNPLGVLDYTVSDGLISSVRVVNDQLTLIQTSAPISQGSSGGPLFNPFGEVIGVAVAIFTEGQNLNFAVPSKYIMPLLQAPHPMTVDEFAEATKAPELIRQVPLHDVAVLAGCTDDDIREIASEISEAIEVGAPLYNEGDHEACFKIYEATSARQASNAPCEGVRAAFTEGLLRAKGAESWKDKAWALRDTFDGLIDVIVRYSHAQPPPP